MNGERRTDPDQRDVAAHSGNGPIEAVILQLSQAGIFDLLAFSPPGWGGNLLRGLFNSVLIAVGAFGIGLLVGIAGAYGKLYGGPVLRDLLELYTTLVRAVPELVLILLLYFAGTDLINRAARAVRLPAHRHKRPCGWHLRARRRAGRLFDRSHPRRDSRDPAGPDRSGAGLWHGARADAEAHHAACHAALCHSQAWPISG